MCDDESRDNRRAALAHRGQFRVDQCACGIVHLTIGAVALRLHPLACAELTRTLLEAVERIALPRTTGTTH
jgi:hypothetical protein